MAGDEFLQNEQYIQFQAATAEIYADVGPPRFYLDQQDAVERSLSLLGKDPVLQALLHSMTDHEDYPGHGLAHITKVARDAGALVILDGDEIAAGAELDRLIFLAHLAGILHDIKRAEPDHARRGAEEARKTLGTLDLKAGEEDSIVRAIANHEAFQPAERLDRPAAQLLSDALYDGDKFRWGPDNFTETLWSIVLRRRIEIPALMKHFPRGLEATERIRGTFRTRTGRVYGPDFIDRALEIGRRLYARFSDDR